MLFQKAERVTNLTCFFLFVSLLKIGDKNFVLQSPVKGHNAVKDSQQNLATCKHPVYNASSAKRQNKVLIEYINTYIHLLPSEQSLKYTCIY